MVEPAGDIFKLQYAMSHSFFSLLSVQRSVSEKRVNISLKNVSLAPRSLNTLASVQRVTIKLSIE